MTMLKSHILGCVALATKIFTTCTDYAYDLKMWDNGRVEKVLGKAVVFSRCLHCKSKERLANKLPRGLTGSTVPQKGTT